MPSTAVPGNQILTKASEKSNSLSTIMGLPDRNKEIMLIFLSDINFITSSILMLFLLKFKSLISPKPSAYGVSPYTIIT